MDIKAILNETKILNEQRWRIMEKLNQALTSLKWIYSQVEGDRGISSDMDFDDIALKLEIILDEIQGEIEVNFEVDKDWSAAV